ncbi:hypothetical protein EDB86DRAFT_1599917 [Lactarius hatsudake]|nr:hypothetical protein EDB86DRAFT_1394611 [Lactarius hatsudake]KAH8991396.1 hypothetical protein EDB86DRAFT_1599917 [Lactarius hatsudake]
MKAIVPAAASPRTVLSGGDSDMPALRTAHVGFSLGIVSIEVAKETSDDIRTDIFLLCLRPDQSRLSYNVATGGQLLCRQCRDAASTIRFFSSTGSQPKYCRRYHVRFGTGVVETWRPPSCSIASPTRQLRRSCCPLTRSSRFRVCQPEWDRPSHHLPFPWLANP